MRVLVVGASQGTGALAVSNALRHGHTVTAGHDAVIITASATKLSDVKDSIEAADSGWLRQSVQLGG